MSKIRHDVLIIARGVFNNQQVAGGGRTRSVGRERRARDQREESKRPETERREREHRGAAGTRAKFINIRDVGLLHNQQVVTANENHVRGRER